MSQIRHVLEDTPGDTEIHRQISNRRMYRNFRFFEIQVFVFTESIPLVYRVQVWQDSQGTSCLHISITDNAPES